MEPIKRLYNQQPEREWLRLERHRTEFAVTMRALAEYLPLPRNYRPYEPSAGTMT